jgi:hypothetical protein
MCEMNRSNPDIWNTCYHVLFKSSQLVQQEGGSHFGLAQSDVWESVWQKLRHERANHDNALRKLLVVLLQQMEVMTKQHAERNSLIENLIAQMKNMEHTNEQKAGSRATKPYKNSEIETHLRSNINSLLTLNKHLEDRCATLQQEIALLKRNNSGALTTPRRNIEVAPPLPAVDVPVKAKKRVKFSIKPSVETRTFNWTQISKHQAHGTFWERVDSRNVNLNVCKLEKLFYSSLDQEPLFVIPFLEQQWAHLCYRFLYKFKDLPLVNLTRAINELDESVLDEEGVKLLLAVITTKRNLQSDNGPSLLDHAERSITKGPNEIEVCGAKAVV